MCPLGSQRLGYGSNNTGKHHLSLGIKQRCLAIVIVGLCTIWFLDWPCHIHLTYLCSCAVITVTLHGRHDISDHVWHDCLLQVKNTEHVKAFHYWYFVSAIHWWTTDSPWCHHDASPWCHHARKPQIQKLISPSKWEMIVYICAI